MNNVVHIKGAQIAPKSQRSSMETLIVSIDQVNQWRVPPFQRPVRVNAKVQAMAEELKRDGVAISGIITLGKVARSSELYVVDGQHRLEAFKMSALPEIIADVRIVHFDTIAEMADEFVQLNSALVRMRPDDILRGLEPTTPALQRIRTECPFVGYDNIRRNGAVAPVLGMGVVITCWTGSKAETPVAHMSGVTVPQAAAAMDEVSTKQCIRFLDLAIDAWGRDPEYFRLWGKLNLTLCMWLFRRLVLDTTRGLKRAVVLDAPAFKRCLMALSADPNYVDWLQGRVMADRDRGPAFGHLKRIFQRRLKLDGNPNPLLPQPAWDKRAGR